MLCSNASNHLFSIGLFTVVICSVFFKKQDFIRSNPVAHGYTDSCQYFFDSLQNKRVFLTVDQKPVYPPGDRALHALFEKNIKFSVDQGCDQCDFRIYYRIEKDGTPVFKKFIGSFLTVKDYELVQAQLIEIFKQMAVWQPGKCKGENVPVAMIEVIYY